MTLAGDMTRDGIIYEVLKMIDEVSAGQSSADARAALMLLKTKVTNRWLDDTEFIGSSLSSRIQHNGIKFSLIR